MVKIQRDIVEGLSLTPIFDSFKQDFQKLEIGGNKDMTLLNTQKLGTHQLLDIPGVATNINQIYPIEDVLKSPIEPNDWTYYRRMK